jgi:methyl-accepting chemotaxis protein
VDGVYIELRVLFLTEKETQACARGLVAEIKPLAINISHTVTEIQAVAVQLNPIITDCVTSNALNPIALSRCLSKVIGPAFNGLSKIAAKSKNDFERYEQENSNFGTQLQQCSNQFRESVASVETLVQEVRQCIKKWEQRDSF